MKTVPIQSGKTRRDVKYGYVYYVHKFPALNLTVIPVAKWNIECIKQMAEIRFNVEPSELDQIKLGMCVGYISHPKYDNITGSMFVDFPSKISMYLGMLNYDIDANREDWMNFTESVSNLILELSGYDQVNLENTPWDREFIPPTILEELEFKIKLLNRKGNRDVIDNVRSDGITGYIYSFGEDYED